MNDTVEPLLDAALDAFLRYGFRRTTMGDIAKAAGLSRQSLYARFANKDQIYAACLELYIGRMIDTLTRRWAQAGSLAEALHIYGDVSLFPMFDMLQSHPDASDLIDAAQTPEGQIAMTRMGARKAAILTDLFAPASAALARNGLTPERLADFVETTKHAILTTSKSRDHLDAQFATLRASVLVLTESGPAQQ